MMILVLGGAGYIGSHTVKEIQKRGEEALVYDDLSQGHPEALSGIELVRGDVLDTAKLVQTMTAYPIDAVVHFAAHCYVGESVRLPGKYYRNNFSGMVSLLNAMVEAKVGRIIFSSSAAVYGVAGDGLITEDSPKAPINPYGRTKLMMEQMMEDFEKAHGIRHIALRYFNAAGADMEGRLGEWHAPETHLIPLAIHAALGLREEMTLFGGTYDTPDGSCIRDFIHVDDLARAHLLALDRLRAGEPSEAFNLGNGAGYSVKEAVEEVRRQSGRDFKVVMGPPRPGDPPKLVADAGRAAARLGWKPRHPTLAEIVSSAFHWLRDHPKGYA